MSKPDALKFIEELMIRENRPFSINDLVEKCDKKFAKFVVQKTLDALVAKDVIVEKTFGKQKIYFPKQKTNLAELKTELQSARQKLAKLQANLKTKQIEYQELEIKLKNVPKVRSLESVEDERDQLLEDIREMNEKLRQFEAAAKTSQITPAEAKKIEKNYENMVSSYRKRKRICNDMLDAILEGYPKSKRELIEDIGVETDESVKFKLSA